MKTLSILILSLIFISCEDGSGGSSKSEGALAPEGEVSTELVITEDYYGVHDSLCQVGAGYHHLGQDIKLSLVINGSENKLIEEIFVSGGLGCLEFNKIATIEHDLNIEIVSTAQGLIESKSVSVEFSASRLEVNHLALEDYFCGSTQLGSLGSVTELGVGDCSYSRVYNSYNLELLEIDGNSTLSFQGEALSGTSISSITLSI